MLIIFIFFSLSALREGVPPKDRARDHVPVSARPARVQGQHGARLRDQVREAPGAARRVRLLHDGQQLRGI